MPKTGGEIFADYLIAEGVPYVCGIPGHGDMGNKDSVKAFREELSTLYGRVVEQIKKGVSREQIIRETRYPDTVHARYPSEFSNTFRSLMENSIGRLYDEWTKANS